MSKSPRWVYGGYAGIVLLCLLAVWVWLHPEMFDPQLRNGGTVVNGNTLISNGTTRILEFDDRTKALIDGLRGKPMVVCGAWNQTSINSQGNFTMLHLDACRDMLSLPQNSAAILFWEFTASMMIALFVATVKIREVLREKLVKH